MELEEFLSVFFLSLILGFIPATIARNKGRDFTLWYLFGIALFIVALIMILILDEDEKGKEKKMLDKGYMRCPFCKEWIKEDAFICKHCHQSMLEDIPTPPITIEKNDNSKTTHSSSVANNQNQ